jgi:hypothetical protein
MYGLNWCFRMHFKILKLVKLLKVNILFIYLILKRFNKWNTFHANNLNQLLLHKISHFEREFEEWCIFLYTIDGFFNFDSFIKIWIVKFYFNFII